MNWDALLADGLKILAVLVLVLFNAFFVAAELALVRVRNTQLDTLVARGNRRAKIARHIVENIDAYISATQFGITIVSLALGVAVEPVFRDVLAPLFILLDITSDEAQRTISILVGFFVNSYLLIVVGELAPKALAIRRTLDTALGVAIPLNLFYRISYPFIWVLNRSAQVLLGWLGLENIGTHQSAHSEEELRLLLGSRRGVPEATTFGRNLMLNALDLRQRIAREVMRPRQELTVLPADASIAECLDLAEKTRYSRFPICEGGDLDRTRGVIHIKDLYALRHKALTAAELLPAARKLIYVPETARLEKLLQLFLERKLHMAVVVDEYGGTVGMVTLENILEEIVGQIQDEFDQEKPLVSRLSETEWEIAGNLPLHDLEDLLGERFAEDVATTSGWITQRLGGFPRPGDTLQVGTFDLRVESMEGSRVEKLRARKRVADSLR